MTAHPETGRKEFVITRSYEAPRDLVWRAFADGEALAQWWGPKGFDMKVLGFEFRPGNRRVVHHAIIYIDSSGAARRLAAQSKDGSYRCVGGPGFPADR